MSPLHESKLHVVVQQVLPQKKEESSTYKELTESGFPMGKRFFDFGGLVTFQIVANTK